MENCNSKFWMGLGIGSAIGALVYHLCCTSKAKQLKNKVSEALKKVNGESEDLMEEAKDKALNAGTQAADKVADKTNDVAEKADDMRDKVHTFAANKK